MYMERIDKVMTGRWGNEKDITLRTPPITVVALSVQLSYRFSTCFSRVRNILLFHSCQLNGISG